MWRVDVLVEADSNAMIRHWCLCEFKLTNAGTYYVCLSVLEYAVGVCFGGQATEIRRGTSGFIGRYDMHGFGFGFGESN